MAINDIYELAVDQVLYDQSLTNTHFFRQDDADPPGNVAVSLIQAYIDDVQADQLAAQSNDLTLLQYRARRVHPTPSQSVTVPVGQSGTDVGDAEAANVSALCAFYSSPVAFGPTTKIRQGRIFLAGVNKTSIVGGLIIAVLKALLDAFIAKLVNKITDSGTQTDWKKVIWDSATETITDIAGGQSRSQSRKKRSRTKGSGS